MATAARADDDVLRKQIVGMWTLVSVVYEDQATKARTPVLGEKPRGRQIATADGRWLALVTAEARPVPKTDEQRAQALRTMISYSGQYRVENGRVITKVEIAWNEAWVGGEQVRFIRFEGDRLFIESPPMPHPNVNNKVVKVIVIWDRRSQAIKKNKKKKINSTASRVSSAAMRANTSSQSPRRDCLNTRALGLPRREFAATPPRQSGHVPERDPDRDARARPRHSRLPYRW